MAAYEYRVGGLCSVPAQQVGELFERLEKSATGLSPASVVDASRKKGTLLHDYFTWDNKEAAELYRQHQAAAMIRNVVVVKKTNDAEERESRVRGFVSIPGGQSAYVTLQNAMSNEEWKQHLLKQAKDDMIAFCAKYRVLEELASVVQTMNAVMNEIQQGA